MLARYQTVLRDRCLRLLLPPLVALGIWSGTTLASSPDAGVLEAHLTAGEFGPARELAEGLSNPTQRDAWLAQIANSQAQAGARQASMRTAYGIRNDAARHTTFGQLATYAEGRRGAAGGAALADFDTLITLMTTTVEPDSWDTIGGPGSAQPFPTGVYVDAAGLMKRTSTEGSLALSLLRRDSYRDRGNRDLYRSSPLRKVSLTRLEKHVQMQWALGRRPDEAMQALAGLYDVKYVLLFPDSDEVILVGPAGGWTTAADGRLVNSTSGQPVLRLDDLVVVLRNAFGESGHFGCAITPVRDRLAGVQSFLQASSAKPLRKTQRAKWLSELREQLGQQEISVFGIDPRTRAARVLVAADYHMKLIGMGLAEGTVGVKSYLDTVTLEDDGTPPAMDVLRWWFTLNYKGVRATESRNAFELVGPGVRVLSENELLDERGVRIHTGSSEDLNSRFAHRFTKHFDELATRYPIYAELRNVFDLAVVANIIHAESGQIDCRFKHFTSPERYQLALGAAPTHVDSVINYRELGRKHLIVGVSGGVRIDARPFLRSSQLADDQGNLAAVSAAGVPDTVPADVWWWD